MRYRNLSKADMVKELKKKDRTIISLYKQIEVLTYYAAFDSMTDALNKRIGIKLLKKKIFETKANGDNLTVCFIDVDKLKKINDNFGHAEGDKLLINVGKIISTSIRRDDLLIRLGGDEFLVVFPKTNLSYAKKILRRVCSQIEIANDSKAYQYDIDLSYGFAEFSTDREINVNDLIRKADKEMYKKKMAKYEGNCRNIPNYYKGDRY